MPSNLSGSRANTWACRLEAVLTGCSGGRIIRPLDPRWRDGRVVEGAPLLRVYTGNGIEGSNPFLFASAAITWRIPSQIGRLFP